MIKKKKTSHTSERIQSVQLKYFINAADYSGKYVMKQEKYSLFLVRINGPQDPFIRTKYAVMSERIETKATCVSVIVSNCYT